MNIIAMMPVTIQKAHFARFPLFAALVLLAASAFAQPLHVIWDRSGVGDSSRYGYTILPLGDQNNDGFKDWAVLGLGNGGSWHGHQRSYLEFYYGGTPPATVPYMTLHGSYVNWPGAVGSLEDVNGDGYVDWFTRTQITANLDHVTIYLGGPNADTTADMTITVGSADEFGTLGDFNGDGFTDLYRHHYFQDYLDILYGGSVLDSLPDWTVQSNPHGSQQTIPISYGDLNGDGYSDFGGQIFSQALIFVYLGGAVPDTVPAYSVPAVGDLRDIVRSLNGDGCDEVVVRTADEGLIYYGGPVLHPQPDVSLSFPCQQTGAEVAVSAGDLNRDGYQDLVLLSYYCENYWWGMLSLYWGHPWLNPQPAFTLLGWTGPFDLPSIQTAAGLGDINGDGVDDLAIGSWDDLVGDGWRGQCVILAGDSTRHVDAPAHPLSPYPSSLSLSAFPNPFNGETTLTFELPQGTASVNLTTVNLLGQVVAHDRIPASPGTLRYAYHASALPSGIYFLRAQTGTLSTTHKLMLLR